MQIHFSKWTAVLCCSILLLNLCACAGAPSEADVTTPAASSESASDESVSEVQEDTEHLEQSGTEAIPNPMVEVTDVKEFADKLGISIDPAYLVSEPEMYIIGSEVAELTYHATNIDGEDIICTLRAAQKGTYSGELSGVFDDMTQVSEEYACNEATIAVTHKTPQSEPYEIYEFTYENVDYCFMYQGEISTMLFGELFDGVLCAIGAEKADY